ncbi:MaoC family dehydratase [Williamsia sterculiae]|uniref:Acyl dehydratase n=1 Tax=Williamsia sterculiae TaxID=1344003 RepID=A0A1N7CTS3_9NOCA|nr:MaoC family dehydratase [Williamsia sterculiae]SIR67056.1 Acyl dehydratase [Williamsia sterculiae]
MRELSSASEIAAAVGETLGTSGWLTITQERVDQFAEATGDHQWIHVDVERAKRDSPFGGPVAHGYLTLSLVPVLTTEIYRITGARLLVNYGSDKVRFPAPVPVGGEIRLVSAVIAAEQLSDDALSLIVRQTIEVREGAKPALVADTVTRVYY